MTETGSLGELVEFLGQVAGLPGRASTGGEDVAVRVLPFGPGPQLVLLLAHLMTLDSDDGGRAQVEEPTGGLLLGVRQGRGC